MIKFRPMLAAPIDPLKDPEVFNKLKFPLYVCPKLDGIRAIGRRDGYEMIQSRKLLPLPNRHLQRQFSEALQGFDGEMILGDVTSPGVYNQTQSAVMTIEGEPNLTYYAFDMADPFYMRDSFLTRFEILQEKVAQRVKDFPHLDIRVVPHVLVQNLDALLEEESNIIAQGFEGICARIPGGLYKHGRSTLAQGYLMKLKRFEDREARITGFVERMTNLNPQEINELGYAKRSSAQENKVGAGMVGMIKVEDDLFGPLEVGPGFFSHDQLKDMWLNQGRYRGQYLKYRFFGYGIKTKPRHPRAVGLRSLLDM